MSAGLRNELITIAYGDIAEAMADVLGTDNATWCSIGQWASSSIGDYLGLPIPTLGRLITRAFGDGNRDVFADVGRAHVTFLETVGAAAQRGDDLDQAWERCVEELEVDLPDPPGQPIAAPSTTVGLLTDGRVKIPGEPRRHLLIRGFRAYREAIEASDDGQRAHLILLGNALIALHEQKSLEPAISAGFRSWLRHLTTFWRPFQTTYRWRNSAPGAWRLRLESWWIRTATHRFVRFRLPKTSVRVGRPLAPTDHAMTVAPSLRGFTADDEDLVKIPSLHLLSIIYETFTVDRRAATCWADLEDRMAYILAMFAHEQQSPALRTEDGRVRRPTPRRGQAARLRRLERRVGRTLAPAVRPAVAVLDDAELDALRWVAADELVGDPPSSSHLDLAAASGRPDVSDLVHDFEARVDEVCGEDGLLDRRTVELVRTTFDQWSTLFYMGLLFRSLPEGYAARRGVRVLGTVSDLATNPVRRVGETAQFLNDLYCRPESWEEGRLAKHGPAYDSLSGVRVIHALVSRQLQARGWDAEELGQPINHEDLLGTMLSFFVPPIEMMGDLGVLLSEEEQDAFSRFWCAVGHLMGLPIDAVTVEDGGGRRALSSLEARDLSQLIRARHHERSFDGVRLAEALVEGVADGFPRASSWMAVGLFQVMGSRPVNRLLLLEEGRGRRRSAIVAATMTLLLRWPVTSRLVRRLAQHAGRLWLQPFLDEGVARPFRRMAIAGPEAVDNAPPLAHVAQHWPLGCGQPRGD